MVTRNFIATENPFSLAAPPAWFLLQLEAFDPALVLFASVEQPCYQVAVRSAFNRAPTPSERHPDTRVFAQHRLLPVGRLLPSPLTKWGPVVLQDLAAMDVRRVGGGDHAADILDQRDLDEERRVDRQIADDAHHLAGEGWRWLQYRNGERLGMALDRDPARRRARRGSVPSIGRLNLKPGGSAVFVGDRHVRKMPPKVVADVHL